LKAAADCESNGHPLSVAELHQAVKDNVAVPTKPAVEGQAGLSLGERNILTAMRTAAAPATVYFLAPRETSAPFFVNPPVHRYANNAELPDKRER
jgi:hypothetical protein